jgi:sugar lactone lactonase YvrE
MIIAMLLSLTAVADQSSLPLPCRFSSVLPAASADRVLVACAATPELYVVSSVDGHTLLHITLPAAGGAAINNLAVSPDGREAAVSWRDGTITLSREGDANQKTWRAPFYANSLAFSPDGQRLYVDGTELETATARPTGRSLRGEFDAPNAIAFDSAGRKAFVAEADTTIRMFDIASGKQLRMYSFDVEPLVVDADPETGEVLTGLADGSVARFDRQLRLIRTYPGVPGMMPVQILSTGTHIVAALSPQTGGAAPAPWTLDYTRGKWTELPAAKDAVATQRRGRKVEVYKIRGAALVREELQPPPK